MIKREKLKAAEGFLDSLCKPAGCSYFI